VAAKKKSNARSYEKKLYPGKYAELEQAQQEIDDATRRIKVTPSPKSEQTPMSDEDRKVLSGLKKINKKPETNSPYTESPAISTVNGRSYRHRFGRMEIVSGPMAGEYFLPEEEKEARKAAAAGVDALKAEGKKKTEIFNSNKSASEITKINEERKQALIAAGTWRTSPLADQKSKTSTPTTETSTPVAEKKPTKKTSKLDKMTNDEMTELMRKQDAAESETEKKPTKKASKKKDAATAATERMAAEDFVPKPEPTAYPTAKQNEEAAKLREEKMMNKPERTMDKPKSKPKSKYILNTDKSGSGTPEYGDINRARDVAAGKQQGLAARGSQQDIPDSSPAKSNKFIIGGGKSGVPASYGTMDDARKFAETERMRQDRIGNGRVRAFGDASGTPASTGGKATFYDFSDADLGISKSDAPAKAGFMDRLRGAMRGRGKGKAPESVTSPSGATSAPSAPSGGFAPPSGGSFPPPSGGRASSFDAGHTGAGHSGAVKFAPQNQFTGGGINVGNQASANQIYGGNISGGVGNISGSSMPSNPVVASTGGAARSTNKNATVLSTGGDAVQSNPRAANASSKGRPTTKKK